MTDSPFNYQRGFGAHHASEAIEGSLPRDQNSPRHVAHGLYAEQVNGTPFTVERTRNRRSWLYRIRPSVVHGELEVVPTDRFVAHLGQPPTPNLLGWGPSPLPAAPTDFVDGLRTLCGAGDPADGSGFALHRFVATKGMERRAFASHDGELMLLPDSGVLVVRTELGMLHVAAGELAVIPRGMVIEVAPISGPARGVVMEIHQRSFVLPERGVIGANGLADERHFEVPVAAFDDSDTPYELLVKMGGRLYRTERPSSPFDVVAWHGNLCPYRYDLRLFNAMGTITWDHPDPSIFTVLSAPLDHPGDNLADLVVFPPDRWDVAAHTFRPPYYHRNAATELNVLVGGTSRDADAFSSGGISLTPAFAAHGPKTSTTAGALAQNDAEADKPSHATSRTLWAQFESCLNARVAPDEMAAALPDFRAYARDVPSRFDPR